MGVPGGPWQVLEQIGGVPGGPWGVLERIGGVPGGRWGVLGRPHGDPWPLLGGLGELWGPIWASLAALENIEKPLFFVVFPAMGASLGDLGDSDLAQIGQVPWTDKRLGPNWTSDLDRQVTWAQIGQGTWTDKGSRCPAPPKYRPSMIPWLEIKQKPMVFQ